MTLVRMRPRSARANPAPRTVDDTMEATGPQVCDVNYRRLDALPVVDEQGSALGVLALAL